MVKFEISITRRHLYGVVGLIAAFALVIPVAGWASDRFTDVPDTNVFHNDISWLADAGVTLGCNPPTNNQYCPSSNVTREQMAAFMHRLSDNQVVDAATAVTAEDSDTLDGIDSTGFLPGGTPPVGTTVRGNYALGNDSSYAWDSFSWGFELPGRPISHFITEGTWPTAECPGSDVDPQAIAGHLCVYEAEQSNVSGQDVFSASHGSGDADAYGGSVIGYQIAAGDFWSYGSWAVTVGEPIAASGANGGPALP